MKIAIPSTEEKILCPHFGHAPYFAIVEINDGTTQIAGIELLKPETGGHSAIPPWLKDMHVTSLIAGGLGAMAIENLNNHEIDVFYGAPELPVEEIAQQWLANTLVLNPQPCNHKHDHDCAHGDEPHGH